MKNQRIENRYQKWAFLFTLPNMILFILFFAIPVFTAIYFSFRNYNGFNKNDFIGLENYIKLFSDKMFYTVFRQTITYVICTVPLIYLSTLVTALLFTADDLIFKSISRVFVYIPTLFSTVTIGLTWRWIFGENFGLINYLLTGMGMEPISWSVNPRAAFFTTVVAFVWASTGFFMLIMIGAIENIDKTLYEAACIDGANWWQSIKYITIPQLRPTTFIVVMLNTINAFKIFGQIITLTGGGPGYKTTYMIQYIYETGFERNKVGYASAVSVIMFFVMLTLSIINFAIKSRGEEAA